jgi:glycosyltransferase involved in cell wall biosynthesis
MKIAVDSFPLTAKHISGISNYLKNVLLNLIQIDSKNEYFLYCKNPVEFPKTANLKLRFGRLTKENLPSWENTVWLFTKGVWMMKKDKIDIFWGMRHMLPPILPINIKKVLTVHDIVWHYFPDTMSRYNLLVMKLLADRSIKISDHIITVSNTTAQAITDVLDIRRQKITVIYHGADQYIPLKKEDSAEYISEKYKTNKAYVLTVSTIEPRKNLATLLMAFSKLKSDGFQLLIAGASGWKNSPIYREYEELGLTENQVKFLGYIPDEDMNKLYSGALLFAFPSFYEGFGMPALEAMACGTPVISSNTSSLPEVVGDAGILLDPDDTDLWIETIRKVIDNEEIRCNMREKGLVRAKLFSWKKAAVETLKVFKTLY